MRFVEILFCTITLLCTTSARAQQTNAVQDPPSNLPSNLAVELSTPLYGDSRELMLPNHVNGASHQASGSSRLNPTRLSTIDADTRWQFTAMEDANVKSPIIRLGDVVRPLQSDMAAWTRLSQATVGLMPANGSPAKLSRDRLAQLIIQAQATPARIRIHGPETIVVQRVSYESTNRVQPSSDLRISPYTSAQPRGHDRADAATFQTTEWQEQNESDREIGITIDQETQARIEQWVRLGLQSQHRHLTEQFDLEVEILPKSFGTLEQIQGVRQLIFLDEAPIWSETHSDPATCRVRVEGRGRGSTCQGVVSLRFQPRPPILVARQSMRRGQRVTPGDVEFQPLAGQALPANPVEAPDQIVGLEVTGLVRAGVPLSQNDFAPPRVIRRGDLLEVQVSGGGIRVTTAAKSLGDGARGELIEIETLQPKRRLLARVVDTSLVEIVTQAPQVSSPSAASP